MNKAGEQSTLRVLIRRKIILTMFVISLAVIIMWIGISVYFSLRKVNLPPNVQKQLQPLSPVLDAKTLRELQNRRYYQPDELSAFTPVKEITQEESGGGTRTTLLVPSPVPVSTIGAVPSVSPSPSPTLSPTPTL